MKLPIGNYLFDGPIPLEKLENRRGIFAVVCRKDNYYLLDICAANEIKSSVETHDRRRCWEETKIGDIMYAAYYLDEFGDEELAALEREIRGDFKNIPCGGDA